MATLRLPDHAESATHAGRAELEISIIGTGAVGLNLGARLACSGCDVLFVARRPEVARAIVSQGVFVIDPATGAEQHAPARAVTGIEAARGSLDRGPVLLCVRAPETAGLAPVIASCSPRATVVSAQNDVDNESNLARHVGSVIGMVVRQTCTVERDNAVLATGAGRVILGRHPSGVDTEVMDLAAQCGRAGFDVSLSEDIHADKWLKLTRNMLSSANALIRKSDHETREFVEIKARILEEARAALDSAGISTRSCDGRDRSLDEEIAHQRRSLELGTSARSLPLYNAVWAALRQPGKSLEADAYHRRVIALATRHGLRAPAHEVMLEAVVEAWRKRRGPERHGAAELLRAIEARAR